MHAPDVARPAAATRNAARRGFAATEPAVAAAVARPLVALAALTVVHWIALCIYALAVTRNGWLFYQGGDQIWLISTGWLLGLGEIAPAYVGYGWPLALAPLTWFTGPGFVDVMPPVILLDALVLAPLALWAVYGLAARVAGAAFGLFAAAVWVVAPYAVIPLWRDDYHERYVEQFLPGALGLTGLADYQSMVLLLAGALLVVRALEQEAPWEAVAAGLVAGFAVGMKPSNGLFLAAPVLAALVARRARVLVPFGLALLPALLTLALWKQRGLGTLPVFALEEARTAAAVALGVPDVGRYVDLDWANLHGNMNHLREYFWSARVLQFLPFAGLFAVGRRSLPLAALLGTWFAAFLLVKGASPLSTVSSGSFFRFVMPGFPAYFLLAVSVVLLVPTFGARLAARWPERPRRPVGVRTTGALAVGLAALPLLVVALLGPSSSPAKAAVWNEILTPVDEKIDVRVRAEGERRVLTWTHPRAGASDVFYRVFRTGRDGRDLECADRGAATECHLRMVLLGTTRAARWVDGSPPPGSLYRIGVAANSRDDPTAGDVATLSPPVAG